MVLNADDTKNHQQIGLLVEREQFLDKAGKYENLRIAKNVIVIGLAFMLQFTAFHGTANLQSSINYQLGTYTLASIYGSLILSNIFLPVIVIRWGGKKRSHSTHLKKKFFLIELQSVWLQVDNGLVIYCVHAVHIITIVSTVVHHDTVWISSWFRRWTIVVGNFWWFLSVSPHASNFLPY